MKPTPSKPIKPHCCPNTDTNTSSCHKPNRTDWLLWGSAAGVAALFIGHYLVGYSDHMRWWHTLTHTTAEMVHNMWWGILLGIAMLAVLSKVPRNLVMSALGTNKGLQGIIRATLAGVLLDLCNHGILMVAAKLYERGANLGQVMAFLIASPWNSFSFTLILITLIGVPWTLAFIVLSAVIAIITGLIFNKCIANHWLAPNPNQTVLPQDFKFWQEAKIQLKQVNWSFSFIQSMVVQGVKDSRMVLRWILFGILLAAIIRAVIPGDTFSTYFGATLAGLGLTLIAATVIEVCSEGSIPLAADLFTRADAPGNSFAFLMAGVATDYTEIMVIKSTTSQWKAALFLPLITLPQIIAVAFAVNLLA